MFLCLFVFGFSLDVCFGFCLSLSRVLLVVLGFVVLSGLAVGSFLSCGGCAFDFTCLLKLVCLHRYVWICVAPIISFSWFWFMLALMLD